MNKSRYVRYRRHSRYIRYRANVNETPVEPPEEGGETGEGQ
ncbi:hypothetical protein Vid5_gp07 [Pantoea phage vB_PagS_Vid5]|uniref:Uncharacterized protein n=1 Tax=Pantoea phage vB_PagS_Vid5 TaxID=2099652 RepID=A0A2P1CKP5_9CAUD|nr:hypothetical protein FDJ45_gp007 [Pantoea phage vB_PagS_Vid5]AVJ51762.1 hypothetical protein Vid5_gp07 [Pantoea phage vB_PagS_Vid5]